MPERPTVLQTTQVGVEITPGVVVPCTKRLLCTQIDPIPNVPTNMYRPAGNVAPATSIQQKEWVQANMSGVLCFNDIVYLLSGLLKTASIATPAGATLTRRWTFKPAQFAADLFTTFTIEKGSAASGAERFAFGLTNSMNLRWTRTESNFTGVMMGQALAEQVAITGGAADVPPLPLDPKSVTIYVGSALTTSQVQTLTPTGVFSAGAFTLNLDNITSASIPFNGTAAQIQTALDGMSNIGKNQTVVTGGPISTTPVVITFQNTGVLGFVSPSLLTVTNNTLTGTTPVVTPTITTPASLAKLTRVESCEAVIPDRYAEGFTLNEADPSFSYVVQRGVEPTCQLQLEHDSVGAGFMTTLRQRTAQFMKIVAHGALIEAGFSNWIQMTFPFFFTANTRGDNNDIYESTYTLGMRYDSTFGGWLQVDVDNALTAL